MTDLAIGPLFPLGGPVPPDLIIGRRGEIEEIGRRLGEGMSTMLVGPRRIGKTTVCAAACEALKETGALVVEIDVPERPDSQALLQSIIDACSRISLQARGKDVLHIARPMIEKLLSDHGIPLDLSSLGSRPTELPIRAVLGLPVELARSEGRRALLFLDELQRVVDYADGEVVLQDLVDLYAGSTDAVVLVDGSDERALEGMFGAPTHFGKLADRLTLDVRIPLDSWREPLTDRFASAGLAIPDEPREQILRWGDGRPYATMAAARYTALSARKTASTTVAEFDVQMGIDEAKRRLADDGA